jgi:hypothetical protein
MFSGRKAKKVAWRQRNRLGVLRSVPDLKDLHAKDDKHLAPNLSDLFLLMGTGPALWYAHD